jgi:hypothetical protein
VNAVKQKFDEIYRKWDLTLSLEDIEQGRSGSIHKNGWTINYRFGKENNTAYIEYFASHRMTNDTLNRIYADGRSECIDYCQEFYRAEDENAEKEYFEHNKNFYARVKGLGLL